MKQRIFFYIMLLIFGSLRNEIPGQDAWEIELMRSPFRYLSANEKVEKLLDDLRYDKYWQSHYKFLEYRYILANDNSQENIQALLHYFEKIDMIPYSYIICSPSPPPSFVIINHYDRAYDILSCILYYDFLKKKLLNQDDENRFCTIWQQKIHKCLETYKLVDVKVVSADILLDLFAGKREEKRLPADPRAHEEYRKVLTREVYEKYTALGYKDLATAYMDIGRYYFKEYWEEERRNGKKRTGS